MLEKQELEFRNISKAFDSEFADYLMDVDFNLIKMEGLSNINPFSLRRDYWAKSVSDVTINPNANLNNSGENKSFINQIAEVSNPLEKLSCYYLYRKYANKKKYDGDKLIKDVLNGSLYIHNSTLYQLPYCIGLSTTPLLYGQVQFSDIPTLPPKRPNSFTNLSIRLIQSASNMFAGATALTDYFVNYSAFTKTVGDYDDKSRSNNFQNLIHGVSDKERISGQSPFTNLSILSPETIRTMYKDYAWVGNDYTIDDLVPEIMRNQMLYLEIMAKGLIGSNGKPVGLPYRFPITTVVVDGSFEKEYPEEFHRILQLNKEFCFLNFMNNTKTDLKRLATCCRLNLEIEQMLKINVNNTFGSFLNLGSHAVVTINLPRIALESKGNWDDFYSILEGRVEETHELLNVHRNDILGKRRIKYHNFFRKGLLSLESNFFSTIGFGGLADAIEYMGGTIMEDANTTNGLKILDIMKQLSVGYSTSEGVMYNIEEVPMEGASGTMAAKDKLMFPGKATKDFYSNQFVPLAYDVPIGKRVEIEGKFQNKTTGGSISHINIMGWMDDENSIKLQNRLLGTDMIQFALNRGITMCPKGHNSLGVLPACPVCGNKEIDHMTRIVGYFVPVSQWNKMKKLDFSTRTWSGVDFTSR